MKIFNTLTRKKEDFVPINPGQVEMYVCGPTVYDYIHIGNARPLVVFDTLHRYLEYIGYDVKHVVNFTDIDDKIINRAKEENVAFNEISERYIEAFLEDAKGLNLLEDRTIHPKATEMISEIISFIEGLIEIDAAYDEEDAVYFDISKAKDYGKLSKKKIEELRAGARIEVNDNKRNVGDFALWKKQKYAYEPAWPSPWGLGRPGWHIECSVMSKHILGEMIDIHAGGQDLQFPHHENEIAQSETLHGHTFAKYWMHNSMITVSTGSKKHEKMSKSKGNFFTLHDIKKEFDLIIVRMWLLSSHYRSPIDFSKEVMQATEAGYNRIMNSKNRLFKLLKNNPNNKISDTNIQEIIDNKTLEFKKFMSDDLNTSDALSVLYELVKEANIRINEDSSKSDIQLFYDAINSMLYVLGIEDRTMVDEILDDEIQKLIDERQEARKNKDFARADEIRNLLLEKGILLRDTRNGVEWSRE